MISLIILFPLLGFLINGLWYSIYQTKPDSPKAGATSSGLIASSALFLSFLVSLVLFIRLALMPHESRVLEQTLFSWIDIGTLKIAFTLRLDQLSSLFTVFITGVATLIHVYSIGYMAHDETPGKFFAYLNLFCFSMLVLVLGASLPVLFLGWEGVGLCSYLLIGYWYTDPLKASAGKKAFIINRVGDLGFLLGMFLIFATFGTLDTSQLAAAVAATGQSLSPSLITAMCLLLFVGCTGKSAQIPLYVWLPDAMAGPTPVSALIHAATMVTSGIYLLARLNFLFSLSHTAMAIIATIGALTAFVAAVSAFLQKDIKKILAYSTISQLGYMFLGCGVGAFSAGVFHVVTHAFFKALLFLGAGSVIHGMHEEQDITKMGGLKKKMPKTFQVFFLAWLAICGIPPFSGFFSKDEILWKTFSSSLGSKTLWLLAALTALMTAVYMTRLFALTFLGKARHDEKHIHVHESPKIMYIPLQILAILSVIGGFIGIPHLSWIEHWLAPIVGEHELTTSVAPHFEWLLMLLSTAIAAFGIFLALKIYRKMEIAQYIRERLAFILKHVEGRRIVDGIYDFLVVKPIHLLSQKLWTVIDVLLIDGIVLAFGRASEKSGQVLRLIQSGAVQTYALLFIIGIIASVGYLLYGLV